MIMIMQAAITALFDGARRIDLVAGDTLFHAGQTVSLVFLVSSGRVHLRRHTEQGQMLVLQNAGPGTVLAEASVYSARYHCDAVASGNAAVASLDRHDFLGALKNDNRLAEAWAATLARSVQAARVRAEIRSLPRVTDRLDAWLSEGNILPAKGGWQDLAAELGVTREALYRELARRRGT